MAGASMNDIKARIKSVESTMQITKAMELVATSKLRRARENAEKARPYYETLIKAINTIRNSQELDLSLAGNKEKNKKTLIIAIAGDRGLAGGYNNNIFKIVEQLSSGTDTEILPVGKKALEYFKRRKREIFCEDAPLVSDVGVGGAFKLAQEVCNGFFEGRFDRVLIVYTRFASMISQIPVYEQLLPLENDEKDNTGANLDPIIEEDPEELLMKILPQYVGGILYSAICESIASECGARRSAMNSANKNASEMIDTLMLKYNRARQAVITQEITEIVSGAEAL